LPFRFGSIAGNCAAKSQSKPFAYIVAFDSHSVRHYADPDSYPVAQSHRDAVANRNAHSDGFADSEPDRDAVVNRNADSHSFANSCHLVSAPIAGSRILSGIDFRRVRNRLGTNCATANRASL
jgi:hypothetical protein